MLTPPPPLLFWSPVGAREISLRVKYMAMANGGVEGKSSDEAANEVIDQMSNFEGIENDARSGDPVDLGSSFVR